MIVELHSSTDPRFAETLALAHRLFPPETREPDEQLREEVDGRSRTPYRFFVWDEGGVKGFIRFARLQLGAAFIVHIGVDPGFQGGGRGRALLTAAQAAAGTEIVLAEVEHGAPFDWWQRQGARVVSETYTQPALRPETAPVPLLLTALGPWETLDALVERFYAEVWERSSQDPLVRRAVGA